MPLLGILLPPGKPTHHENSFFLVSGHSAANYCEHAWGADA